MLISEILGQIRELKDQLKLTLSCPESVKLQLKQITLVQKQLKFLKKEINVAIREINQKATQTGTDSVLSVGLDVFGKHKWAGRVRAETRREVERQKRSVRQPYMDIKDMIESLLLESDRLKLTAEEYLLNHKIR